MFADQICGLPAGPPPSPVRWLLVDAGAITHVDYTAAQVVRELQKDLTNSRSNTGVRACGTSDLRSDLDRHHLTEVIAPDRLFDRLHEAIDAYHAALVG